MFDDGNCDKLVALFIMFVQLKKFIFERARLDSSTG